MDSLGTETPIPEESLLPPVTTTLASPPKHKTCTVEGCNEKHYAKGFCQKHYNQSKKDPTDKPKLKDPEPQLSDQCLFMITKNESKKVLVTQNDHDGTPQQYPEDRMVTTVEQCPNSANGINGFCQQHSYPVLKSTYKVIPIEITRIESDDLGKPTVITETEQKRMTFNVGEHLPAQHYTQEELDELHATGIIGFRTSLTSIDSNRNKRDMSDQEIDALLMDKRPEEIVGILGTEDFTEMALHKVLGKTASLLVIDKIRSLLK